MKYVDKKVRSVIDDTHNTTAETLDLLREINTGLLFPLQKPKLKKTGEPCDNSSPIMLLFILDKIFTITMQKRIWDRVADKIPKEQAVYQPGKSTS